MKNKDIWQTAEDLVRSEWKKYDDKDVRLKYWELMQKKKRPTRDEIEYLTRDQTDIDMEKMENLQEEHEWHARDAFNNN